MSADRIRTQPPPVAGPEDVEPPGRNRLPLLWDGRPPFPPKRIGHVGLRALYADWLALRRGRAAPGATELEEAARRRAPGFWAWIAVERPDEPRYLHVEPGLIRLYGADPTGRRVAELFSPRIRREALAAYAHAARETSPLYKRRTLFGFVGRYGYHRLILPATHSGDRADRALLALYPTDRTLVRAAQWREPEGVDLPPGLRAQAGPQGG